MPLDHPLIYLLAYREGAMMDQPAKIRISLMSDLHIEFEGPRHGKGPDLSGLKGNIDLVLLAGDVDVSDRASDIRIFQCSLCL